MSKVGQVTGCCTARNLYNFMLEDWLATDFYLEKEKNLIQKRLSNLKDVKIFHAYLTNKQEKMKKVLLSLGFKKSKKSITDNHDTKLTLFYWVRTTK